MLWLINVLFRFISLNQVTITFIFIAKNIYCDHVLWIQFNYFQRIKFQIQNKHKDFSWLRYLAGCVFLTFVLVVLVQLSYCLCTFSHVTNTRNSNCTKTYHRLQFTGESTKQNIVLSVCSVCNNKKEKLNRSDFKLFFIVK